ncbi:MAG: hypothetical protein ACKVQT_37275 [Burkholderiales bacterium]
MRRLLVSIAVAATVLAVLSNGSALAQANNPQEDREREVRRRAQQAISRIQDEKDAVQKEKAAVEAKLAAASANTARLEQELARLKGAAAGYEGSVRAAREAAASCEGTVKTSASDAARAAQANEELKERLRQADAAVAEVQVRARTAVAQTTSDGEQRLEAERKTLTASIEAETERTAACEQKNIGLARLGYELIDRYEKKGVLDSLRAREPIFRFRTVEQETLLESYRDRIDDLKIAPKKN